MVEPAKKNQLQDLIPELNACSLRQQLISVRSTTGVAIPVRFYQSESDNFPVILLHGLQSHSGWFIQSANFVADQNFPVYAPDRRGSGLSQEPKGDCPDFNKIAEDIDSVVEFARNTHKREKVHILGHCFGTIPAFFYALNHQEKIKSLILATPAIYTNSNRSFVNKALIAISSFIGLAAYFPTLLKTEMFTDLTQYQKFIEQDPLSLKQASGSFFYSAHKIRNYIIHNSNDLKVPVFMAVAGRDSICDNLKNKDFFGRLTTDKKRFKLYPQTRHIIEFSNERDQFFSDIRDWLSFTG